MSLFIMSMRNTEINSITLFLRGRTFLYFIYFIVAQVNNKTVTDEFPVKSL